MASRPSTCETSAARLVPCESSSSAWQVEIHANAAISMREVFHRNSRTAFNLQVHEFIFAYFEFDLHRLAANLAIFDVGLAAGGQIHDDTHRFRAIRAVDRSIEEPVRHVRIKVAVACRPTALR